MAVNISELLYGYVICEVSRESDVDFIVLHLLDLQRLREVDEKCCVQFNQVQLKIQYLNGQK